MEFGFNWTLYTPVTNATIVGYGRRTMRKWSNSHGARTVAVESYGRREIFWTVFTHRTMNRSF